MKATPWTIALLLVTHSACVDETVLSSDDQQQLEDDVAPSLQEHDPDLDFRGRYGVIENMSTQRFRFDVSAFIDADEAAQAEVLYASHAAHLRAHPDAIPSVQTLWTYLKQLDDSIYAGVELAVQQGLEPTLQSKQDLLAEILAALVTDRSSSNDEALVFIAAALELGGALPDVPVDLIGDVGALKQRFVDDVLISKPIGFYTWSDELQHIWQQDRLLQQSTQGTPAYLRQDAACALASVIVADDSLKTRYLQLTELYHRLTNPLLWSLSPLFAADDIESCRQIAAPVGFLGPSQSPEIELYKKLYGESGIPANADLMNDLIAAIRDGSVDLSPNENDGWYAHKLFALETLLVTDKSQERSKIAFTARYKKHLTEAFKSMYTQTRETHIKQLEIGLPGSAQQLPTVPHFRLEPLATVYARVARSYLFLEAALDQIMGSEFLDRAIAFHGAVAQTSTLRQQLQHSRDLAFGLYALSCQDIGLHPQLDGDDDPSFGQLWNDLASQADQWLLDLAQDELAAQDVRVLVPVGMTAEGRMRYWAVVGVRTTMAGYSYLEDDDMSAPAQEDLARVALPTEQFIEVTADIEPMTRQEFRAFCDQYDSSAQIQAALEGRDPGDVDNRAADGSEVVGCSALPHGNGLLYGLLIGFGLLLRTRRQRLS